MNKIIAATGHRPEKLGGYSKEVSDKLLRLAKAAIATPEKPPVKTFFLF
jgi:hypothetical protein